MEQPTTLSPVISAPAGHPIAAEPSLEKSNVGILDEFQNELVIFWRQLPNKAFFFLILGAWLALFQFRGSSVLGYIHSSSLFAWMLEAYNSPNTAADDKIGNLIPFLVLGIMYWKRKELLATGPRIWWPAIFILAFAVLIHIVGFIIQEPRVSIIALFTGIYGLTGLAWGWRWMLKSFFPFFLFVFSIPLGNHADIITTRLQLLVCWLVELVSHNIFGIGVIRRGALLFDPAGQYQYEVAAACSGIRSLFSIFLLATAYGFLNFKALWKRLLMMGLAFPFAVIGNLVRMLFIILAAAIFGQKGGDYVHDDALFSLVPYIPAILGLLWVGGWLEKHERKKAERP
ncbi:MAG TPA: exosortase/archaeosortase family protein [Verrucomicrobiae bacterium]|nr:exosortase/archaeosortase family protein [Verrucomicrobiae bacterium]